MPTRAYRRWRIVMWVGAGVTAFIAATWTVSLRWIVLYETRHRVVAVSRGVWVREDFEFELTTIAIRQHMGLDMHVIHGVEPVRWLPRYEKGSVVTARFVPLWMPALPTLCLVLFARRRARTLARVGCCPKCGYSREGLPSDAICPECGHAAG